MARKNLILILIACLSFFNCSSAITTDMTTYKQKVEKNVFKENIPPISNLTFEELLILSKSPEPDKDLKAKLEKQLSTAYVINRNSNEILKRSYLRVAQWNINRGFNINEIEDALTNPKAFEKKNIKNLRNRHHKSFKKELEAFSGSDILCLNEVDVGLPRTKYKNIAAELADLLGWNYAYSTEFVEVGPLFLKETVDKNKYKGLHGNVIISRFPIVSTKVVRLPDCYDWYREEVRKKDPPLERFRKFGSKAIFRQHIERHEVRHGGRAVLIADIKLPNNKIITVVSAHLEDRTFPDLRFKQFNYLLQSIKDIKNPVILAGDFNTSTTDTKPTCIKKEIVKRLRDPNFILRFAASFTAPGMPVLSGLAAIAFSKILQYKDPFFPNIPVIFPNQERKFYNHLRKFAFSDGCCFDLSGDKRNSSNGRRGLLANSNQRHWKGFKSTFKLEEPRIIAYFKLDWFFIKPIGNHLKPFNGRTLKTFNKAIKGGISDHNPITVDLRI